MTIRYLNFVVKHISVHENTSRRTREPLSLLPANWKVKNVMWSVTAKDNIFPGDSHEHVSLFHMTRFINHRTNEWAFLHSKGLSFLALACKNLVFRIRLNFYIYLSKLFILSYFKTFLMNAWRENRIKINQVAFVSMKVLMLSLSSTT